MELERVRQAIVSPHWLPGHDAFWYRRHLAARQFEFVYVDAGRKIQKTAFNHQCLANKLAEQTGQKIDPKALPFTWIELEPEASSIRFRFNNRKWKYDANENLESSEGGFTQRDPRLLRDEVPSAHSKDPVKVTFINHTGTTLSLSWIDWDIKAIPYATIEIGESKSQRTYSGHVWRLADKNSDETMAIYVAPKNEDDTFIVEETTMEDVT
jgi:dipeptidyl-peptidase 4